MHAKALLQASATALALTSALALGACGRQTAFPAGAAQAGAPQAGAPGAGADAADLGYHKPPELRAFAKAADGVVSLSGTALPSSRVSLVSPAGARVETMANGSGAWTALLGPVSEPTLYHLAQDAGGQTIEAEGLVAVLPGAPIVALLRAGYGAQVQGRPSDALKILAVDYDSSGGAVVSGRAKPLSPVRVIVDGALAIPGAAGADGVFSLTLPGPLKPGLHKLQAQTPQAAVETEAPVTALAPPRDGAYQVQAQPFGWRIDWITAGGGPQTTLLLGG